MVTIGKNDDLGTLGEFGLIARLRELFSPGPDVSIGLGDDAAVIKAADGSVVATTDMAVEDVHFRRDWSSADEIGRKVAAANLADVVSMGARPTALLVALGAPPNLPTSWVLEFANGLRAEAARAGASIAGGDTVRSEKIVISVTALGSLDGRSAVLRSGAQPGDVVALAGVTGLSAAGLALLTAELRAGETYRGYDELTRAHRAPKVDYQLALDLAISGAHSMCDVSDGLLADLGHIAEASGVRCQITASSLDVAPMVEAASDLGIDPRRWALTGGEDHAFVATISRAAVLPAGVRVIGEVIEGTGVEVTDLDVSGWAAGHDHFARK